MVLTKDELIQCLQKEVRILVHLAGKVDPAKVDYRPTPKQRSIIELLRYMVIMGPQLVTAVKTGNFDPAAWGAADAKASAMNLEQATAAIQSQSDEYAQTLGSWTDDDFREEIEMFGGKFTRGYHVVTFIVCGYAAYRTQLFCYLKSCGRDELNTMNLWGGMDAPMPGA